LLWVPGVAFTFYAGFLAWRDEHDRSERAESSLNAIRRASPSFRFDRTRWTPIYRDDGSGARVYWIHLLQLWLVNCPDVRAEASLARNVSILVSFHPRDGWHHTCELGSQWIVTSDPNLAGYMDHVVAQDVPANDNPAKMILVLRNQGDPDCYAHSFGMLAGAPDGRHAPFRLAPGWYRVRVRLRGDNVDQELSFRFTNPGATEEPTLVPFEP
jgi:hypothetical protein